MSALASTSAAPGATTTLVRRWSPRSVPDSGFGLGQGRLGARRSSGLNENYARELLELFTLGVGNYAEKDVLEAARALTGWTLDPPEGSVRVARPQDDSKPRSMLRDGSSTWGAVRAIRPSCWQSGGRMQS